MFRVDKVTTGTKDLFLLLFSIIITIKKKGKRISNMLSRLPSLTRTYPVLSTLAKRSYQIQSTTRKIIPVYPPAEKQDSLKNTPLLQKISKEELDTTLDPTGWRRRLIDKHSGESLRAGDVVRVIYDKKKCNLDNFIGYILSVNRKELVQDASLLLRNQVSKVMVEVRVPLFSPLIQRIDILKRSDGSRRRNKHYYIRGTRLDVGNLDSLVKKR